MSSNFAGPFQNVKSGVFSPKYCKIWKLYNGDSILIVNNVLLSPVILTDVPYHLNVWLWGAGL